MTAPPFIQLKNGGGQRPPPPPQPARQGYPPPAGGQRPMPSNLPPSHHNAGFRGPMQPQIVQNMFPPGLPRAELPVELRLNRPVIQVSDINQRFLSEDDMRVQCTEYLPVRFEKVQSHDLYDDNGQLVQPNWDKAVCTQVQGMSIKDITKEIRWLDMNTHDVVSKKATLPPALLRQLDVAMDDLIKADYDTANYVWTLAQIDQQLKKVDTHTTVYHHTVPRGHKSLNSKHHHSSKKRRYSTSGKPKKKCMERVTLTAYFKRSPRPQAPIRQLYEAKERARAMTQGGGAPMGVGPPGFPPAPGGPPNVPLRWPAPPPNPQPQGGGGRGVPQMAQPGQRPPVKGRPPGNGRPPVAANIAAAGRKKQKSYKDSESDSGSETSSSSGFSNSSNSTNTSETQSSHSYKKRGRGRDRSQHRNHNQPRESSRAYGIASPKQHSRHERNYILDPGSRIPPPTALHALPVFTEDLDRVRDEAFRAGRAAEAYSRQSPPPPPPPPPPAVTTSASDIDRLQEDAYRAGARDARARDIVDEYEIQPRPRYGPRIIQPPRNIVRAVDPRFLPKEALHSMRSPGYSDDDLPPLERLSMNDPERLYHQQQSRRYSAFKPRNYDFNSDVSVDDYDNDFVTEIRGRPYSGRRHIATNDYIRRREIPRGMDFECSPGKSDGYMRHCDSSRPMDSGYDPRPTNNGVGHREAHGMGGLNNGPGTNPFNPRYPPRRGSFERRRG
ncbi:hypothetical protein BKA67DRAFT_533336 [Truncatella angustata]|uniref:Uncharacterized protein n=1 Tax=Truncatella angustata TaxID=152316 RepID=A0A9P8UTZ2_9PEZI|nr:uncharacterized protein BKA67DRAFT_533336 [Truncatella angustata]KAH6658164.1 hypothetical protein BKA67DRAFT_533336 [Truncatella angustata]KAH8199193.1 hypothetical protein TruAng_006662 [Truncatella angustata]